MDKKLFSSGSPGKLTKINIFTEQDWAFVPDGLPTTLNISETLWPLLLKAREELARLDGVGRHMPNYELLLKPLQQREALKSSSLEGTYATPEQLLFFEIEPKEPKSQHDQVNSWKEVFNYSRALRRGQKLLTDELPISLRLIKELHKELLSGVRGQHRDPGNFRRSQVHIGSDRRFIPPPPNETIACLNDLEKYIHIDNEIDPLIFCFLVHYQFETIHPFLDGNGRVGRLLLSLMIYKWCDLTSPWIYLSAFFDKYKDEYIYNLFNVSAKGDWESWIAYCLRATTYQAKDAINRFDKLVSLRESYLNKIANCKGSIRLHKIIDKLFESPAVSVPQISKMFGTTYPTASNDIKHLVKQNILVKGDFHSHPKIFLSPEIINIAYRDFDLDDDI
jgi:Fic family protein